MRAPLSNLVRRLVLMLVLFSGVETALPYTYHQVGVYSNILIDQGRVIFIQADGSLTALNLEDGAVLVRDLSRSYSGDLKRVPSGILVLGYSEITWLRPDGLSPMWETKASYDPNILEDALVSYDGNGLVECRSLENGNLLWSYNLPGALQVVAQSEMVLVHRAATYEATETTTSLLDLRTGKEIFRKTPPPGIYWNNAFFDGTNIYVQTGPYIGKRSDYKLERLAIWNTRGEETSSIPIPTDWRNNPRNSDQHFELDNKTFDRGRVYDTRHPRTDWRSGASSETIVRTNGGVELVETKIDFGDGLFWIQRARNHVEYELQSPSGTWLGTLPYLQKHGGISALAASDGKVVLGSNLGHVECIDSRNGESKWLYVFPTMRHTMSYSSPNGLPPMMATAAGIFRRENMDKPKSGFQIINGKPSTPSIILDPKPADPFRDLLLYSTIAWAGAGIPLIGFFGLHRYRKIRPADNRALVVFTALLTAISFACFFAFGRVSVSSYIALLLATVVGVVLGFSDVYFCWRRGQRIWAVACAPLFGAMGLLILPMFLPFLRF